MAGLPAHSEEDIISRPSPTARTLLVFIDGLGWGAPDPRSNPCLTYGGEVFRLAKPSSPSTVQPAILGGTVRPIDAVLGVAGIPQSATGQTTLLTGVNAQGLLGKHLTGFPNPELRALLLEKSILKVLTQRGRAARFLNAYRPRFWDLSRGQQMTLSATTVANLAADLPFFTLEDLREERAVYQEFTNGELQARGFDVPSRTPAQAGCILAGQARRYDFTLFEYFQSDRAGHSGDRGRIEAELAKLDAFMLAVLGEFAPDLRQGALVVVTSDHGNLEDPATPRHTTNPIPLAAWGRDAEDFVRGITRLDQVAGAIIARHGGNPE